MTLQGIFPTWLGEVGAGTVEAGETVIVDAFDVQLAGDVLVDIADDEILVTIETEIDVEVDDDQDGVDVVVYDGDIGVEV